MATNYLINGAEFSDNYIPKERFSLGGLWGWGTGRPGYGGGPTNDSATIHPPKKIFDANTSESYGYGYPYGGLTGYGLNWKEAAIAWTPYYEGGTGAAIKTDGTLWTSGYSYYGELGYAYASQAYATGSTWFVQLGSDKTWSRITGGRNSFFAIKTDGTLWSWGLNNVSGNYGGNLGDGTTTHRSSPVQISGGGTNWRMVTGCKANSTAYAMAIKTDGTLWGWGMDAYNQLGNGTGGSVTNITTPRQTGTATNWKFVSCGNYNSCGIKTDNTLWVWGNYGALLGDGSGFSSKSTPVQMAGNNWKLVSAGNYAYAGIKTDGTLWSCGRNSDGTIGDGTTTERLSWTQEITGSQWKTLKTTPYATYAIKTDGTLWAWGSNYTSYGQTGSLGLNSGDTGTVITTPRQVANGGTNWKDVFVSSSSTIAIRYDE
jgi:alpha-tubulin suppressor-like RCC1 family protein